VRACAHSKILGFIYVCRLFALFVITCSVVSFCCSFLLGLSQSFLIFITPCARCYFFFSQKEYPPTWQSIPSHKHTRTTPKIRLLKTILEFLLHNTTYPPHRCRHLLDYSFIFISFFFGSVPIPFFSRFFNYENSLNLSSVSEGLQLPPTTDTRYHGLYALNLLSVTTRLSAHSYIS